MIAHFISVLFTGFIIYIAWPGSSLFSWHPTLMAVAFVLLMFEGLLIFSPQSSLLHGASRQTKVKAHWLIQATAVICALGGFFIIYLNKNLNEKPHFTSWHGCIGLITVIYICLQSTGGAFIKYPALARAVKIRLADLKLYHAMSGCLAFTFACVSLLLGMYSNWFSRIVTGMSWYGCLCCVLCMAMIVISQLTSQFLNRYPRTAPQSVEGEMGLGDHGGKTHRSFSAPVINKIVTAGSPSNYSSDCSESSLSGRISASDTRQGALLDGSMDDSKGLNLLPINTVNPLGTLYNHPQPSSGQ